MTWVGHMEMLGLEKVQKISGKGLEKVEKFIFKIAYEPCFLLHLQLHLDV